jgi:hypothetical protein
MKYIVRRTSFPKKKKKMENDLEVLISILLENHDLRKDSTTKQKPGSTPQKQNQNDSTTSSQEPKLISGGRATKGAIPFSRSLFKDSENRNYLEYLMKCDIETIKNEPVQLEEESAQIESQLSELAFNEHQSFL